MLRILMATNTRWTRNLGGAKVQLELADAMRELGHHVEKFSFEDAFPRPLPMSAALPRLARTYANFYRTTHLFARKLRAHVRARGSAFDVVDVVHPDLPYPKRSLRFEGLVVARSVALIPTYAAFDRSLSSSDRSGSSLSRFGHGLLSSPGRSKRLRDVQPTFHHADLINVSSQDDVQCLDRMGFGGKVVYFPFGISDDRRRGFAAHRLDAAARLSLNTIAFIGSWTPRKGSGDWPKIAAAVLAKSPETRFLLLGTGFTVEHVLQGFPPAIRARIEVVPSFESDELPRQLERATVGAFPSYLEGFGFGALELLAAGLPTVGYDAPGPRDVLGKLQYSSMTTPGRPEELADALVRLLRLSAKEFTAAACDSTRVAGLFDWKQIARATADCYAAALSSLPST